jgi:hypothetical protein
MRCQLYFSFDFCLLSVIRLIVFKYIDVADFMLTVILIRQC